MRQLGSILITSIGGVCGMVIGFGMGAILQTIIRPPIFSGPTGKSVGIAFLAIALIGEVCRKRGLVSCRIGSRTLLGCDSLPAWSRWLSEIDLVDSPKPTEPRERD